MLIKRKFFKWPFSVKRRHSTPNVFYKEEKERRFDRQVASLDRQRHFSPYKSA